jgi:Fe-S-cluster-containing hydrogenase component 2
MHFDRQKRIAVKCDTCYGGQEGEAFSESASKIAQRQRRTACMAACPYDRIQLVR